MNIHNIESGPKYITTFIYGNRDKLIEIYNEGLNNYPDGILFCKCSEKDNRIDVQFIDEILLAEIFEKKGLKNIRDSTPIDKKSLLIEDLDLETFFLIYV